MSLWEKGVEFKGTISYSGTVRIDEYLDGETHTAGVWLIGEEAVIQATITAGTIVCTGKVTGDVVAKECVTLRAPAVMNGRVKAPVLSMKMACDSTVHAKWLTACARSLGTPLCIPSE